MKLTSDTKTGKIVMRGPIGDFEGCVSANDVRDILGEHTGDITIELDSEGGSVFDGLSIYNAIRSYSGKVTVHIDTLAASIATVIACAADEIVMNSNAKFMIHRCWTLAMGNCKDLEGQAKIMRMLDEDMSKVYAARSGADADQIMDWMDAETWFSADEAKAAGFVDDIHDVDKKPEPEARKPLAFGPFKAAIANNQRAVTRIRLRTRLDDRKS